MYAFRGVGKTWIVLHFCTRNRLGSEFRALESCCSFSGHVRWMAR